MMELIGFDNGNFLICQWGFVKMLVFYFLAYLICLPLLLAKPCIKNMRCLGHTRDFLSNIFHFNAFIRLVLESYFFLTLSAVIELYYNTPNFGSFDGVKGLPSYIMAMVALALLLFVSGTLPLHFCKTRCRKDKETFDKGHFATLYDGTKR